MLKRYWDSCLKKWFSNAYADAATNLSQQDNSISIKPNVVLLVISSADLPIEHHHFTIIKLKTYIASFIIHKFKLDIWQWLHYDFVGTTHIGEMSLVRRTKSPAWFLHFLFTASAPWNSKMSAITMPVGWWFLSWKTFLNWKRFETEFNIWLKISVHGNNERKWSSQWIYLYT